MNSHGPVHLSPSKEVVKKSIFEKIWGANHIVDQDDGTALLYVDRHYIYEVSSPQAFDGLRKRRVGVRHPSATFATMDHNVPTSRSEGQATESLSERQMATLAENCRTFDIELYDLEHPYNGVIHVVFPELGLTQPGMIVACGDSHTLTHGALGALPIPVTSEIEHILTTQTVRMNKPRSMFINILGEILHPVCSKDLAMYMVGRIGADGCNGYVVEFGGPAVRALSVEGRMTLCNMATETGAQAAIISPDEKVFEYLENKPFAPGERYWETAKNFWSSLSSDPGCHYDRIVELNTTELMPQITWGTNPSDVVSIQDMVPTEEHFGSKASLEHFHRAINYTGLTPGTPMTDIAIDYVFIGSCTNGRLEDLRTAAAVLAGRKISPRVRAIAVPGSASVKRKAEEEGIAAIFKSAGFEWRDPGCSMCLGMNGDVVPDGLNCASTSNRNFENRQGRNVKTFLVSPAMAAAAALAGKFMDITKTD